ncbi:hypothetical protein PCE31107_03863 [Pandoraea cepalis]|uniref:Polysaccharide biosynthesis protein n=1 Tax=Pandoraea cepalis TaxID=2508294 RepID=A0A5E4XFD7_9BURK|nr:hypothetical protein PCE31107_03863 [Pandoraea cepalis]
MFSVLILTMCIQGGIIASQLFTTLYLTSSEVGVIRALESILSILVLGVSFGAPSLAIREAAAHADDSERAHLMARLLIIELVAGGVTFVVLLTIQRFLPNTETIRLVSRVAAVALLTNSVRVLAGFAQGLQITTQVSIPLIVSTTASMAIVTVSAYSFGIGGWVVGRYVGEATVLLAFVFCLRDYFRKVFPLFSRKNLPSKSLVILGFTANLALVVRLVCDNLPILGMTAAKVKPDQIGYFGIATLVLMAPTLLMAVTSQVELPRIVTVAHDLLRVTDRLRRLTRALAKIGGLCIAVSLLAGIVNRLILHISYTATLDILVVISLALPLRGIALSVGTVFMALRHYRTSMYVNVAEVMLTSVPAYVLARTFGAYGAAAAFLLGSLISAILHLGTLRFSGMLGGHSIGAGGHRPLLQDRGLD